jgi:hypothetical protein
MSSQRTAPILGRVEEIAGDDSDDIFDGLSVDAHFSQDEVYVPAEQVASITDGEVTLKLTQAEFEQLGPYVEPAAQIDIESEQAPLTTRIEQRVDDLAGSGDDAHELQQHRESWLQRTVRHLKLLRP